MADYYNGKLIDVGLAEQFGIELEFNVLIPEPKVERKFCFLPKPKESLHEAKFTMLNVQ